MRNEQAKPLFLHGLNVSVDISTLWQASVRLLEYLRASFLDRCSPLSLYRSSRLLYRLSEGKQVKLSEADGPSVAVHICDRVLPYLEGLQDVCDESNVSSRLLKRHKRALSVGFLKRNGNKCYTKTDVHMQSWRS